MWPLHSDCFGHVILLDYSDKKLLKHFVVVVHFVFVIYRRLSISFDALCYMSFSMCVCGWGGGGGGSEGILCCPVSG